MTTDPDQLREQLQTEIERAAELIISTSTGMENLTLNDGQRQLIDMGVTAGVTATMSVLRRWDWINPNPGDAHE